jgi:hypothetical protein
MITYNELERNWKKVIMASCLVLSQVVPEANVNKHRKSKCFPDISQKDYLLVSFHSFICRMDIMGNENLQSVTLLAKQTENDYMSIF